MTKFRSAASILRSEDFVKVQQQKDKYVKHEFQDYAYRLAEKLGDMGHKHIYMRLARSTDRILLEQAASFALGYFNETNKGKLFMWKLKELKSQLQDRKRVTNFDYKFVLKEMKTLYDQLYLTIYANRQRNFDPAFLNDLITFAHWEPNKKWKALIVGLESDDLLRYLTGLDIKTQAITFHKKIDTYMRAKIDPKPLLFKSDPLEAKLKPNNFNFIYVPTFWKWIPLENENKFWHKFYEATADEGQLVIIAKTNDTSIQTWQEITTPAGSTVHYLDKQNSRDELVRAAQMFDWQLSNEQKLENLETVFTFTKKLP